MTPDNFLRDLETTVTTKHVLGYALTLRRDNPDASLDDIMEDLDRQTWVHAANDKIHLKRMHLARKALEGNE